MARLFGKNSAIKNIQNFPNWFNILLITEWTLKRLHKDVPNWQNFAKSDHTDDTILVDQYREHSLSS